MNDYMQANRDRWNELAPIHARTDFYDVESFKAGRNRLHWIERTELGDVSGKSLLHLMCHFGLDTLSWAQMGATVTGVDYSDSAVEIARSLARDVDLAATFIHANVYDLPAALTGEFDIVFTSYGVLGWLPDLARWAVVIARFLKPGGTFYIVEAHPTAWMFDDSERGTDLKIAYSYFDSGEPIATHEAGTYADRTAHVAHRVSYTWTHSLSEIINALIGAGLRIQFLHEFPVTAWRMFPLMECGDDGMWRLPPGHHSIPLTFSLMATR